MDYSNFTPATYSPPTTLPNHHMTCMMFNELDFEKLNGEDIWIKSDRQSSEGKAGRIVQAHGWEIKGMEIQMIKRYLLIWYTFYAIHLTSLFSC
jgi:hypothetical protein